MFEWIKELFAAEPQRNSLGDRGENLAARYLRNKGYRIIIRNFRCEAGEVDIIAKDGKMLVFVEVKTRADDQPMPEDQVNGHKQHQLTKAARVYLTRYGVPQPPARFDVVAIVWPSGLQPTIRHHEDAFEATFLIMIDTHCHLTDPRLRSQLEAACARAAAAGVKRIVTIGTHSDDWTACLDVCRAHANVRCAIGVHPNNCEPEDRERVALLRGLQANPTVVALGEMGLDYHYGDVPRPLQRTVFEKQLALAVELNRPVVIHCREAMDDCLDVMKDYPVPATVYHCFTGTVAEAERILAAGYLLGFTGVVTYKNAPKLREIARTMPADRILVETDAPYLSPEPVRKHKTCEPGFVMHTAAAVAAARGVSLEEIDRITTENAQRFYRWPVSDDSSAHNR